MNFTVASIGVFACLIALVSLSLPQALIDWAKNLTVTTAFRLFAAGLRIVLGILLVYAATPTRFPQVIEIIGYLCVIDGAAGLLITNRFEQILINRVFSQKPIVIRLGAVVAFLCGCFLIYAGS